MNYYQYFHYKNKMWNIMFSFEHSRLDMSTSKHINQSDKSSVTFSIFFFPDIIHTTFNQFSINRSKRPV